MKELTEPEVLIVKESSEDIEKRKANRAHHSALPHERRRREDRKKAGKIT